MCIGVLIFIAFILKVARAYGIKFRESSTKWSTHVRMRASARTRPCAYAHKIVEERFFRSCDKSMV